MASTLIYLPSPEMASTLIYLPSPEVASTLTYLPSLEVASSKTLYPVSNDPLLVRFTSSGIRASALDTGSILSYPIFFFVICLGSCFCLCSVICVLVHLSHVAGILE